MIDRERTVDTHQGGTEMNVGDRVWLMLPTRAKGRRDEQPHTGTVTAIDDGGIHINLDQPALTANCYATCGEVQLVSSD